MDVTDFTYFVFVMRVGVVQALLISLLVSVLPTVGSIISTVLR